MITTNFVRFTHMTLLRQNSTTLDWTSLGHNFGLKFLQNGKKTRELRFGARRRPSLARLAHKIPTDPARTNRDLSAYKEKKSNRQYRFLSIDSLESCISWFGTTWEHSLVSNEAEISFSIKRLWVSSTGVVSGKREFNGILVNVFFLWGLAFGEADFVLRTGKVERDGAAIYWGNERISKAINAQFY